MAILEIRIKDKMFMSHNGVNVSIFTPHCMEGNGWKCEITEEGDVTCIATKTYFDVKRQIRFCIKNGHVEKTLKIGDGRPTVLKSYKLNQWPQDGVIRLSNGYIDKRTASFRESEFQNFLDEYRITALRYEIASGVYKLTQEVVEGDTVFEEKIETDGKEELIFNDVKYPEKCKDDSFSACRLVEITEATWAIKTSKRLDVIERRVLYTMDNLRQIRLPKPE